MPDQLSARHKVSEDIPSKVAEPKSAATSSCLEEIEPLESRRAAPNPTRHVLQPTFPCSRIRCASHTPRPEFSDSNSTSALFTTGHRFSPPPSSSICNPRAVYAVSKRDSSTVHKQPFPTHFARCRLTARVFAATRGKLAGRVPTPAISAVPSFATTGRASPESQEFCVVVSRR